MRKIIAFTAIAFAIGVFVGWAGPTLATNPALGSIGASREAAEASMLSPLEMMHRAGHLPVQAPSDPF
jgi:hypothetical protein